MFRTSLQDLLNLDVVGAEAAVEFEVVGVVEEGAPQGEQQLLWAERGTECVTKRQMRAERDGGEKAQTCEVTVRRVPTPPPSVIHFSPNCPVSDGF